MLLIRLFYKINTIIENSTKNIYIIIPTFNEESVIQEVVKEVKINGYKNIIVVDDGSSDNTWLVLKGVPDIITLRHSINLGKGAAVKTGIEASKALGANIVVTIDGDGQHNPADIKNMLKSMSNGNYDVILGSRLLGIKGMPFWKIKANHFGNFCTWAIYGLWVNDSQSGFRVYSKHAISLINTKIDRYGYDSEIIGEIVKNNLTYYENPIEVRYTKYSINKKNKMNFNNGLKTLIKMILSS